MKRVGAAGAMMVLMLITLAGCFFEPKMGGEKSFVPALILKNPPYAVPSTALPVYQTIILTGNSSRVAAVYNDGSKVHIERWEITADGKFENPSPLDFTPTGYTLVDIYGVCTYNEEGYILTTDGSIGYLYKSDNQYGGWVDYPSTGNNIIDITNLNIKDIAVINVTGLGDVLCVIYWEEIGSEYKKKIKFYEIGGSLTEKGEVELATSEDPGGWMQLVSDGGSYLYALAAPRIYKKLEVSWDGSNLKVQTVGEFDGFHPESQLMTDMWEAQMAWWNGYLIMANADVIWRLGPNFEFMGEALMRDNSQGKDPWDGPPFNITSVCSAGGFLIALSKGIGEKDDNCFLLCLVPNLKA